MNIPFSFSIASVSLVDNIFLEMLDTSVVGKKPGYMHTVYLI